GLATRVWELRDGQLHDFAGPFTEWEALAEQRRTASIERAREQRQQQSLTAAPSAHDVRKAQSRDDRKAQREAVRAMEQAEAAVTRAEAEVGRLARALEDPALYDGSAKGAAEAQRLGAELSAARAVLHEAEHQWAEAAERAEALSAT
ncbi:MAG: hypothetical protein MUD17_07645, partial [Gemmatimonadaceae bacterium]|nr:hypothetical protein [Gemmatimonadaceae bacterium]